MRVLACVVLLLALAAPAAAQPARFGPGLRGGHDLPALTLAWEASPRLTVRAEGYLRTRTRTLDRVLYDSVLRHGHITVFTEPRVEETTRGAGLTLQFTLAGARRARGYAGFSTRYLERITWHRNVRVCPEVCVPEPWFRPQGDMRVHTRHARLGGLVGGEARLYEGLALSAEAAYFGVVVPFGHDAGWMYEQRPALTLGLTYYVR